ncbi:MAG TPA: hypothetical protein VGX71_16340 [Pseudaminobacter sp.]|nr:hypothetical protein [Pseudaminobacter sp.]
MSLDFFAWATLGLLSLAPAFAQRFEDLNRPLIFNDFNQPQIYRPRPGITECGRDRPCDWQEPDSDISRNRLHQRRVNRHWRHSERGTVNTYRQPQIKYDLAVPIEPTRNPLPGRSRLGLSRKTMV